MSADSTGSKQLGRRGLALGGLALLTGLLTFGVATPAQAAPDRSVTAGAQIPSGTFAFVNRMTIACSHHVATSGNDGNGGTSLSSAWRTPAKAVASLQPGQTACVHAGTYDVGTLDPGPRQSRVHEVSSRLMGRSAVAA